MDENLMGLEPKVLWEHFDQIRQIPRPSKSEGKIADHVKSIAEQYGCEWKQDEVGNVVVKVPATPGAEGAPVVVLQGHLDMVCEKDPSVDIDFEEDPIQLRREGDMLYAQGTTLGADNGIGVAAALAVMTSKDLVHGPLELLFTVDEETGLTGAQALGTDMLEGRILLNLDSEEIDEITIGCAGGADTVAKLRVDPAALGRDGYSPVKIVVAGLKGGHSGVDIHLGRANAILLLGQVLARAINLALDVRLVEIDGGSKHNAIPRDAHAVVWVDDPGKLGEIAAAEKAAMAARFAGVETDIDIHTEPAEGASDTVWSQVALERLLRALGGLPNGVIRMSAAVPGLVETSNNVAILRYGDGTLDLTCSSRSSDNDELARVQGEILDTLATIGFEAESVGGYPGWTPNPDSPVLHRLEAVYREVFGKDAKRSAIHAGLECGLLGAKYPGMDMVSFGPDIHNPHSPTEHVNVVTVEKFWNLLVKVLEDIAKEG